ncbi:O-acetyl-ADP-ribose deacetylase [Celeribacter ethanolicus]|uniref:O-acetyl-ADP-ribose deacetylase n=1 Tax=Celeribacter ethanolicus TaxID=1758178 RepID=A0A291GFV8_9RHOB|nr:O-acetyl-ADP-ribose deacetylase [Celeribacter ethanolicus]ATG49085.1 O-acetyl-ADP-ribose deacetylase [Celeribacter ethanolicus]
MPLRVVTGSITDLDVDAVVNAANSTLLGGGGVDGAIHRAAGPGLLTECRGLGGCLPGQAKLTGGYDLKARSVIHTVGPVWRGGNRGEDAVLASCYREAMRIARARGLRSIAFPAISTGVYGFPKTRAARIAARTIRDELKAGEEMEVLLCAFSAPDAAILQAALDDLNEEN